MHILIALDERDRIASGMECQDPHMRVYNKWYEFINFLLIALMN